MNKSTFTNNDFFKLGSEILILMSESRGIRTPDL